MTNEDFFVHIEEPIAVRKAILETSKDMLKGLQSFELFKETRIKKAAYMAKLRIALSELTQLNGQLKQVMPKVTIRIHEPKVERKKYSKAESDLEKLERELAAVEEKIKDLGHG